MEDVVSLASSIEDRVRVLKKTNADLKFNCKTLETQCEDLNKIIENQKYKINELENKINVLSISSGFATGKDSTKAKLAINELVREIDKCIQLLDK